MKELLVVLFFVLSGVVAEPPAPYAPSGWRPAGPAFELPQKTLAQQPRSQEYLPPVEPRRPAVPKDFGVPDNDVSVQGLPTVEQQPIFQVSPVNGQQYVGPTFNADIQNLNERFRQTQTQQEKARQFARQRQLDSQVNTATSLPNPQIPSQFLPRTTPRPTESAFTTPRYNDFTTQSESTTESLDLNEGETDDVEGSGAIAQKQKVSVEVSKQKLQEFPPELFLSPLAQYRLQPQLVPLQQFGQLKATLAYQPVQEAPVGFDGPAHFSALPSILAQRQLAAGQQQNVIQTQQGFIQSPELLVRQEPQSDFVVPEQQINQLVQQQVYPQFQVQPAILPQQNQQPNEYGVPRQVEGDNQNQPQFVYQQTYQPQDFQQFPEQREAQNLQNFNQDLQQYYQNLQQQQLQLQLLQQQQQQLDQVAQQYPQAQVSQPGTVQGQDAFLQSGIQTSQGNDIEQTENEESDEDSGQDGNTASAVATAFGTRTQPRPFSQYGSPIPRVQANPGVQTNTDAPPQDDVSEEGPAVASAVAVARGSRREKSAKLRSRRVRHLFTLDRSGRLVLAQEH